jgi:hypothetical protein
VAVIEVAHPSTRYRATVAQATLVIRPGDPPVSGAHLSVEVFGRLAMRMVAWE